MIWIILLLCGSAYAGELPAPPTLIDEPPAEQLYLQKLYNEHTDGITNFEQVVTVTSAHTAGGETVIKCNGTFTVTLPPALRVTDRAYYIKNIGTGVITLDGDESETIDRVTTQTLAQDEVMTVISDGSEWDII